MISDLDADLQFLSHAELVLWRLACSSGSSVLWLELASCFEAGLDRLCFAKPSLRYQARAWFAGYCNLRASLCSSDDASFMLWHRLVTRSGGVW